MFNSFINKTYLLILSSALIISCKRDKKIEPIGNTFENPFSSAKFYINVKSNSAPIEWDSLNNINAAGNTYSIHNINMYISNITMKRNDGYVYYNNNIFYIDPAQQSKNSFQLDSIPKGNYIEISYFIGIDSARNIDFGLGPTIDNLNMAWPTAMGGGYHFIKIEGHYLNTANIKKGYAIHLGKNKNLVEIKINNSLTQQNSQHCYSLTFNVNEVFQTPYLYNLNLDNNYTMSDSIAMSKIKINMTDAFTINQNN